MPAAHFLSAALLLTTLAASASAAAASITICRGMCDASAVVLAGPDHFVVADDEDNILRVYSRTAGGAPVQQVDLSTFLRVAPKEPEADLEGAAPFGDRVYWITSHARNKNGRARPSRHRFFATTHTRTNATVEIKTVGVPYTRLLADLLQEPRLRSFQLTAASRLAPKSKDALNIEGLVATPEGTLLIGFRNPIPDGKALLVPLLNPDELIAGQRARFGAPLLLDLGGLGIRSITRTGPRYLLVAGAYDGGGRSHLYEWNGGSEPPRRLSRPELADLNPEAIEVFTENGVERLFVVSDDGTMKIGGQDCKDVQDPNLKYFRATAVDL